MANYKNLIFFLLALLVAPFSFAVTFADAAAAGTTVTGGTDFASLIANRSISAVASNGSRAVVPAVATATISRAAMAAAAAKLVAGASAIGAAYTAYEVYNAIKDSGYTTCPPPDFFCKPAASGDADGYLWQDDAGHQNYSKQSLCDAYAASSGYPNTSVTGPDGIGRYSCNWATTPGGSPRSLFYITKVPNSACYDGSAAPCVAPAAGAGAAYTQAELASGLLGTGGNWDPARSKRMLEAIKADSVRQPGVLSSDDIVPKDSPLSVTGSPVTVPEVTTSSKTSPNSDGSTSTTVKKETTTFTPSQTGPTVGNGTITAKESTVVTTTVTNNTTNVSNTSTETVTPAGPAEPPDKSDLCKLHPEIIACQKLGDKLEATPVPDKVVPLVISKDDGWGASDGACPAAGHITAMGRTIAVPWDVFCQFAQGIRPFLLAVGYMIAVGGFIGLSKKG